MRNYLLTFIFLTVMSAVSAQTKPKQEEKAPTSAEMEQLMKEAQKALEELSPEDKKMMEEMGIKIPGFNDVSDVNDKQLSEAFVEDGLIIPSKKTELIASLPKRIFSNPELSEYVKKTNNSVASVMDPAGKQVAEKIMETFKNDPYYGAMIASSANGMWVMGMKEPAVYLMGIAVNALPNADNYNNYAAYLTMTGAAHMAIPILQKLNSIHKNNSTILNNLAHAWLQLGDEEKATSYLDSTIRIYAYHPQANNTKSLILESKGKKAEAVTALKRSLKHSVTRKKMDRLSKLENDEKNKWKGYYVPRVYFSTSFNLGMYTALIPTEYANTIGMEAEQKWTGFRNQIREEKDAIDALITAGDAVVEEEALRIGEKAIKQEGIVFSHYYNKSLERYNDFVNGYELQINREGENWIKYVNEWAELKSKFSEEMRKENEAFNAKIRAGANLQTNCEGEVPIANKYVKLINDLHKQYNTEKINKVTTEAYSFYNLAPSTAVTDAMALRIVLQLKSSFLGKLLELKHEYFNLPCTPDEETKPDEYKKGDLPDFDEVNCKILNTIYSPGLGKIIMRCNTMSLVLDPILIPLKGGLTANFDGLVEEASIAITVKGVDITVDGKFDKSGDFLKGNAGVGVKIKGIDVKFNGEFSATGFTKGSVDLGIDGALKFLPADLDDAAPIEISLKNKLGIGMEVNNEGIADFYVKDKVEVDMATNIEIDNNVEVSPGMIATDGTVTDPESVKLPLPKNPSVSVSADNSWSVNAGKTSSAKLSGLRAH